MLLNPALFVTAPSPCILRILGFGSSVILSMKQFKKGNMFSWTLIHYFNSRFENADNFVRKILNLGVSKADICYFLCPPSRPLAPGAWVGLVWDSIRMRRQAHWLCLPGISV